MVRRFYRRSAGYLGLALVALGVTAAMMADGTTAPAQPASVPAAGQKVPPPPAGRFYHGVYPGGQNGEEDDVTAADLDRYQAAVGQKAAWVYFSNNWYTSAAFPAETCRWIRQAGAVPFIRLMLRSRNHKQGKGEKFYTLQRIIDGQFDKELSAWGRDAKAFGSPLLVEYGTEVNGDWFGWNGKFQGGGPKAGSGESNKPSGPQRFVAAYRHIVRVMADAGADNLTWVFHLDTSQEPPDDWNRFECYYPGDDVVDFIAVSCYGPQTPMDKDEKETFRQRFDPVHERILKMAPAKPIVIAEFGCTANNPTAAPEVWAGEALDDILGGRWKNVCGLSWWNERWENDDNPQHNTTMRVQDIPALAEAFRHRLAASAAKLAIPAVR